MITLNDYLYSGDTLLRILQKYSSDLRKEAEENHNEIDMLLFFRDPLATKNGETNDRNLLRLCDENNIPVATNIATAEVLIHGLERGDLDWRNIVNPKNNMK